MVDRAPITAEDVARREFPTSFRGFEQYAVRAYLGQVAAELAVSQEREISLRERLTAAEARAVPPELGEAELAAALGAEAGRLLQAARQAATEIRDQAQADAEGMRTEAEGVLRARTEEADRAAAAIRSEAEQAMAERRADADGQARAAVDEALARGREMVAEAQAVRERVLRDMARRRRTASQQLEQLRVGRERLLESYRLVRLNLDEATSELTVAEVEARAAAEALATTFVAADAIEPSVEELEAEVAVARGADPGAAGAGRSEPAQEQRPVEEPQPVERPTPARRLLLPRRQPSDEALSSDDLDEGVRILTPTPAPEVIDLTDAEDDAQPAVHPLFARIRADREAAVASAQVVLADVEEAVAEVAVEEPTGSVVVKTRDLDETALQGRDAEVEPVERALGKALKRVLADEQNEVLDALRRLKTAPSLASLLPEEQAHVERFRSAARPRLEDAARVGRGSGAGAVEIDDLAQSLAAELADALRGRIAGSIEAIEGGDDGDDESEASASISAAYREWKTVRAESLARHHVAAAHVRGRFATAPEGAPLRWVVDGEEGRCPDCDDNALAGPVEKGKPFPTGQPHPPAHIGCRCLILPTTG